jgi:hypothetical protein
MGIPMAANALDAIMASCRLIPDASTGASK